MRDKKECEIVQDLLVNYADGILNPQSKKLVEKHLSECESCLEELKLIKEDMKNSNTKEQIELDYLKKIRIKSKIKSVIIAICIVILIVFLLYLSNFIKVNNIMTKAEKSLQSDNFYKETSEILLDNHTAITKEYYKDGKYKRICEIYSDNGIETRLIQYGEINSNERTYIDEIAKKVTIEKGDSVNIVNDSITPKVLPFVDSRNSFAAKIGTAFVYSVDTHTYTNGRKCYVIKNRRQDSIFEIWIDKETGLPVKQINSKTKVFFEGTDVVKEMRDSSQEYKYKFDFVTDEDVTIPDLSNYTVENKVVD